MGTTAKGYPYPEGTDLVMDGDDAIQALAEAIDARIPNGVHSAGTSTSVGADTSKSVIVTFPTGRFTGTAVIRVTATPVDTSPAAFGVSIASVTNASFDLRVRNYTTDRRDAVIGYHAIQWAASGTALLAGDEAPANDATVTCPTAGCENQGVAIDIPTHWTDDTGVVQTVDEVQCGVCGTVLTTTVQEMS